MQKKDNKDQGARQAIGGEFVIPAAALAFTAYYISTIIDSPWTAQVNAFMVGGILTAIILVFLAIKIRALIQGEASLGLGEFLAPVSILPKRLAFIGLCFVYVIAIQWLGFTLTTFLFLWVSMVLLDGGRRIGFYAALAAVMAAIGYGVFIALFETRLPIGFVEKTLAGLI